MKVSEVEQQTGVSRDTLRYYEREGLISPPPRNTSGFRNYTHAIIDEIRFIRQAKDLGFSLDQIRRARETLEAQGRLCPEFSRELESRRDFFTQRIRQDQDRLQTIQRLLTRILPRD
ncbi:MerR family transcriptional regulator [Spirochaeta lutea]|uniref:MerR family transcriptional regulator n=1 Tax=Spirochaeta lutea TaxID=1480694 RepID=UPI0006895082|nr:MerR family transcriptional regulator [Spirochaeta lutea]